VVAVLVTVMALGMFVGAEKVERICSKRAPENLEKSVAPVEGRRLSFATMGVAAVFGVVTAFAIPRTEAAPEVVEASVIEPEDLALRLVAEPWTLRIIDFRDTEAWTELRIPGSVSVPVDELQNLGLGFIKDSRDIVLVDQEQVGTIPEAARGYNGRVFALRGGFAAWEAFAIAEPDDASTPRNDAEREQAAFRRELNALLTGQAAAPPPPPPMPTAVRRPTGGGGGCN